MARKRLKLGMGETFKQGLEPKKRKQHGFESTVPRTEKGAPG